MTSSQQPELNFTTDAVMITEFPALERPMLDPFDIADDDRQPHEQPISPLGSVAISGPTSEPETYLNTSGS